MHDLVPYLNRMPKSEWCVVRCGSNIGHQKGNMCLKEFKLHAQNMIIILHLSINIVWRGNLYDHLMHKDIHFLQLMKCSYEL